MLVKIDHFNVSRFISKTVVRTSINILCGKNLKIHVLNHYFSDSKWFLSRNIFLYLIIVPNSSIQTDWRIKIRLGGNSATGYVFHKVLVRSNW